MFQGAKWPVEPVFRTGEEGAESCGQDSSHYSAGSSSGSQKRYRSGGRSGPRQLEAG